VAAGVLKVYDEVAGGLGDPGGGRVRGSAADAYPARGVLDDRQDMRAPVCVTASKKSAARTASALERRNTAQPA
jgi:hypothetical protein